MAYYEMYLPIFNKFGVYIYDVYDIWYIRRENEFQKKEMSFKI